MWNYRVVRKKDVHADPAENKERVEYFYGIHEAFYDKDGHVWGVTQDSVEPFGENVEELRHSWIMMAEAFGRPILDYDNIPEPGYDAKEDPIASALDEVEAHERKGIPLEEFEKELEEECGPFDHEAYRLERERERVEKERIHAEAFVGTPTLEELIKKVYDDYCEHVRRERSENPPS